MSRPQSKPADMYNYNVAAFLKSNKIEYTTGISFDFRKFKFDARPNPIPPQATLFDQEISIDLVISRPDLEYLCECKYSETPRPITVDSREFKESLLEFIGLEKYKVQQFRKVGYLLITNMPTKKLIEGIQHLRAADDKTLEEYAKKLLRQAKRKWSNFKSSITSQQIRSTLANLQIIEIGRGRIIEAEKTEQFNKALEEIIARVKRKDKTLFPQIYTEKPLLRLKSNISDEKFLKRTWLHKSIEISEIIIEQIIQYEKSLKGNIIEASVNELPFLRDCYIESSKELPIEKVALILTEIINDFAKEHITPLQYLAIFLPSLYKMYFIKIEWALAIVEKHRTLTGQYTLPKTGEIPIRIPPYVYALLVKEAMRLKKGIIVDTDLIVTE